MKFELDEIDLNILRTLMANGRKSWSELATELKLSPPSTADRIRRLEENGVICGYSTIVNPNKVGCELTSFVAVSLEKPRFREAFLKKVNKLSSIQECHHISGDDDYLLKVRCKNTKELDEIVSFQIKSLDGVARTRTTIVLGTTKESSEIPVPTSLKLLSKKDG